MGVPTPTATSDVLLRHALADVVRSNQRILIVGCPAGTFDHWMAKHPALVLWPSTEAKVSDDRRIVPAEVGAILVTRMLSHALSGNVRHQAKERGLCCPLDTYSPGAVRRLLAGIVDRPTKGEEEPVAKSPIAVAGPRAIEHREPDIDTQELTEAIDDAIAALELVKEKVVAMGAKFADMNKQLVVLDTLKQFLK